MSRRPLGCHTTNNICQNISKALWFNACHLIAIYNPVLPASKRWKHCTLRQWSTDALQWRRAKIWGYHRTGWSCHPHPCLSHPACAEHLSISCDHVYWLFVSSNSCSRVCHIPTTHQTQNTWEKGEALQLPQLVPCFRHFILSPCVLGECVPPTPLFCQRVQLKASPALPRCHPVSLNRHSLKPFHSESATALESVTTALCKYWY